MSQQLNPDDFIITRKRKKYRFAKFANAENCFEFDEWQQFYAQGQSLFTGSGATPSVTLELGAGTGFFSVELAARHPEKMFVAVDVKADRLQRGAYVALEHGLKNVFFVRARADQITELFAPHSLAAIWLTFPDPFPRPRSARRRMTHPMYLAKYAQLLGPSGAFYLKHDNPAFFAWSLEQLVAEKWHLAELSFDLHEADLPDDYKILTSYEQRWLSEGLKTHFVKASRP